MDFYVEQLPKTIISTFAPRMCLASIMCGSRTTVADLFCQQLLLDPLSASPIRQTYLTSRDRSCKLNSLPSRDQKDQSTSSQPLPCKRLTGCRFYALENTRAPDHDPVVVIGRLYCRLSRLAYGLSTLRPTVRTSREDSRPHVST